MCNPRLPDSLKGEDSPKAEDSSCQNARIAFGNQMCWPITVAEITNNLLVPRPYTPPNGP